VGTFVQRKNGLYYGVFSHRGKRVWRSTFSRSEAEARRAYEQLAKEFICWDRLRLSEFRRELLGLLNRNVAETTLQLYDQSLKRFIHVIGDRQMKTVSPYHVELFKTRRLKNVSDVRVSIEFRTLKAAFSRAVKYGMLKSSPFTRGANVRIAQRQPRFLTAKEFKLLMSYIDDPLIHSIVLLAVCTSMRLSELINLKWADVDACGQVVNLVNRRDFVLKGKRGRVIPLNRKAMLALSLQPHRSEYVFSRSDGGRLNGRSVSRRFKQYVRKAGVSDEIHFHSLRHTGATWLVQQNVPITYVKEILGHSSLSTTMIYAHATPQHLRDSVCKLDSVFLN
jgi:integrase